VTTVLVELTAYNVMRLLHEDSKGFTLESLGFWGEGLETIHRNIKKPNGMILVTGPTGSGKTTTLYTVMDILNTPEVNISTIEDPIEYRMPRINQTQVSPKIGLTFSGGLRSLVRQDPDIIMVGEIRDNETASLAVNAALTGHLVLSTLHTNSAAGSIARLVDMQVEPFLLASTINCIEAQRLVRTLHPGSREKYRLNKDTFPYTDPSLEMEVDIDGKWVEVVGCGVVKGSVLEKLEVDSSNYSGWAFGFGLESLAIVSMALPDIRLLWSEDERVKKQLKLGQKFVEVSKYPPILRDISFVVKNDFIPNDYFDLVRENAPELIEEVELLDKYENAKKFGEGKISYAFRVVYRSLNQTLTSTEIDKIHKKLEEATTKIFGGIIR